MIKYTTKEDQSDLHEVVSKNGLKIKLGIPSVMDQIVFSNVIGDFDEYGNPVSSQYRASIGCLLYVKEVDGLPQAPLHNKIVKDALIKKLGDDGFTALMKGVNEIIEKLNATETLEAVKK